MAMSSPREGRWNKNPSAFRMNSQKATRASVFVAFTPSIDRIFDTTSFPIASYESASTFAIRSYSRFDVDQDESDGRESSSCFLRTSVL